VGDRDRYVAITFMGKEDEGSGSKKYQVVALKEGYGLGVIFRFV
jgi:hypothetical protein